MAPGNEERTTIIPRIVPRQVLSFEIPANEIAYTEREVAYYALGVGAAAKDPTDPLELSYAYHPNGQKLIKVLPTFAVSFYSFGTLFEIPGLNFDPKLLLHGEQYIEIHKPLPTNARVRTTKRVSGLHDKGKAALVELELTHRDMETGELLAVQRFGAFLRGAGSFSSSSDKPFSYTSRITHSGVEYIGFGDKRHKSLDTSPPDVQYEDEISPKQALLYRLASGDMNPLHADPQFASDAGFQQPILHGLCTLGFAVRAVIRTCCSGDPTEVASINARFLHHVYPGETVITSMRREDFGSKIFFRCKIKERNKVVLAGVVCLRFSKSKIVCANGGSSPLSLVSFNRSLWSTSPISSEIGKCRVRRGSMLPRALLIHLVTSDTFSVPSLTRVLAR